MPIVSTDIKYRLSGGAANSDPNASLGGAKSSVEIVDATLHNLFDIVSSAEASSGDVEYRCFYIHNGHATLALQNPEIFIQTNTPSADTDVSIGLDPAAVDATATTIVDESTPPAGVTFTQPGSGAPLTFADLPAGSHKAVWVRRNISAAASAVNGDSVILRVQGDTAA